MAATIFALSLDCRPHDLTDQQATAVINATRPLQPQERVAFLTALETLRRAHRDR
jgi:hypothetical protein